jgi:hypothetical protein
MKGLIRTALAGLMVVLALAGVAHAGEYGHYAPFMLGIRDYFVPAKSGFYYSQYNLHYTSDDFRDKDGNSVKHFTLDASASDTRSRQRTISGPFGGSFEVKASVNGTANLKVDVDLDVQYDSSAIAPAFIYVSDWEILGAKYAAYVAVPAMKNRLKADIKADLAVDLGVNGTASLTGPGGTVIERSTGVARTVSRQHSAGVDDELTSLGDIFVQPVWLGWNGKHFAASFGYGLYMPTGNYDVSALDNTGMGFWTHQFQAAGAWYPWEHQGTALTLTATYELNSDKEDKDVRPGDRFTLNYGVSQFLPINKEQTILVEVGVCGYNQWQVGDDSGSDVAEPDVHDRVFGYGVQLGLAFAKYDAAVSLRWMNQYSARDNFQGDYYGLNFVVKF